ncbi:hypothetical protein CON53_27590 [Bacillus cereus]|nr:hypothetical protein CON53_27590 [Bacillus cereus]PFH88499.1 hypothetical protein COI81_13330 [Bacillus cereus]PFM50338.1 hypothetical protein COJ52_27075 [Bacillus cereus]PGS20678.1 hypothetical protein COC55_27145 [Bacillus cereus]
MEDISINIILVDNYRYLSKLYFYCARNEEVEVQEKLCYEKARYIYEKYIVKENENEINVYDYTRSAITYKHLGNFEECKKQNRCFIKKRLIIILKPLNFQER